MPAGRAPILLVEANRTDVDLARRALRERGLEERLEVAHDGGDALDFIFSTGAQAGRPLQHPGVIVLDLDPPRRDSLELLRRVREDPRTASVPVVALTAAGGGGDVLEIYQQGASSCVVKPADWEQFACTIQEVVEYWLLVNSPPACPAEHASASSCDVRSRAEQGMRDFAKFPDENPNPILRVGAAGTITYVNRAGETLLGPWGVTAGGVLPDEVAGAVAEAHRCRRVCEVVVQCGHRIFSARVVPLADVAYCNLYFHDETERRQAELLLQESEERLRLITAHVLDMVSQVTLDGLYLYLSPSHRLVLGYEPETLLGTSAYALVHPDDLEPVKRDLSLAIQRRESRRFEFRYRHADGRYLDLEAVGRLILDEAGNPRGAVLSARDITERKRLETDLRRRTEELERFNRLAVGRELRMVELKREINELSGRLGLPAPYAPGRTGGGAVSDPHPVPMDEGMLKSV
jgi:PAS domain S-box-containing protein